MFTPRRTTPFTYDNGVHHMKERYHILYLLAKWEQRMQIPNLLNFDRRKWVREQKQMM